MQIEQTDNEKKGAFKALDNGRQIGIMTYTRDGNTKLIIDHTEVDKGYEGKGIGKQLVMQAVDFARSKHLKILPRCPFANAVFKRTKNIQDVLF